MTGDDPIWLVVPLDRLSALERLIEQVTGWRRMEARYRVHGRQARRWARGG